MIPGIPLLQSKEIISQRNALNMTVTKTGVHTTVMRIEKSRASIPARRFIAIHRFVLLRKHNHMRRVADIAQSHALASLAGTGVDRIPPDMIILAVLIKQNRIHGIGTRFVGILCCPDHLIRRTMQKLIP